MKLINLFSRSLLTLLLTTQIAFAQIPTFPGQGTMSPGAEFFAGKHEGKPLIKVNVVSGLKIAGVYHVPIDTDLSELISYAGGATEGAELDEVHISSVRGTNRSQKVYDFYAISKNNQNMPTLANGDVVQIDVSKDTLGRTAIWIGIISGITSVLLSGLAYQNSK